jgi:hypothetical protein
MNPTQPTSPQNMGPLNIGNVVSAGFRLFNDNRQSYLLVALRAVAWITLWLLFFVLTIGLMIGGGVGLAASSTGGGDAATGGLLLVIGVLLLIFGALPLGIFCYAKAIYNETLITANAYGHLTNQPEAMPQTNQRLRSQTWPFWLARFLVGCILYVVSFGCSMLQQVAMPFMSIGNDVMSAIGGILLIVAVLLQYGLQFWLAIRLLLPEVVLALEDDVKNVSSIPRSWNLTQGSTIRIGTVLLIAFLITCPLYILTIVPPLILGFALFPPDYWMGPLFRSSANPSPEALFQLFAGLGVVFLLYILLLQVVQVLVLPFWQTIKAVIYYDLRSRREGLGLSFGGDDLSGDNRR